MAGLFKGNSAALLKGLMGTPDPSFSSNQTVDSGFNSKGTKVAPDAMSLMGRARRKGYKKTSAASSDAATGKKKKEV